MSYSLQIYPLCLIAALSVLLCCNNSQADERIHARGTYGDYSVFGVSEDIQVVVYSASWCDACTELALLLLQQGIAYKNVDIGKDPAAAKLLKSYNLRSLPVVIIKNTLLQGFSRITVSRKLDELRADMLKADEL